MNWQELLGHLIVAAIVGVMGFLGWLWKNSIYGKFEVMDKAMETLKRELKSEAIEVKLQAGKDVAEAKALAAEGLADIKETLRQETDAIKRGYVPLNLCNAERNGCQLRLLEKIDAVNKNLGDKLDLVINRQAEVIGRIDRHINGSHSD